MHAYYLAGDIAIHTRLDDLSLISRSQVCQNNKLQIVFKFFSTVVCLVFLFVCVVIGFCVCVFVLFVCLFVWFFLLLLFFFFVFFFFGGGNVVLQVIFRHHSIETQEINIYVSKLIHTFKQNTS